MAVRLNENKELVAKIKEGLKQEGRLLSLPSGKDGGYEMYLQRIQGADERSGL